MSPLVRDYRAEEFDAAIPEVEALPLRMMRQAAHAWRVARSRADWARAQAGATPDARLVRCVAHREREAQARLGLLAGAAAAWTGRRRGRLFLCEREELDGSLLLAWGGGRPAAARDVGPEDADRPGAGELLRLGEMEVLLAVGAVDRVVEDREQRALTHKLLISGWDDEERWRLATGTSSLGGLARSAAWLADCRLRPRA